MLKYKAVDFFCGIGGMTYGLRKAGINILAGIDIDPECKETYEKNNSGTKFICEDIKKMNPEYLIKTIGITQNDNNLIFIGCSPCQFWTKMNTNKAKSEKTKNLIGDFQKFVEYFKPGFIVIENVPGILKNKIESKLSRFLTFLERTSYKIDYNIINTNHYGVPQNRIRFLLVASRVKNNIKLPNPEIKNKYIVRNYIGKHNGFNHISSGHHDDSLFIHTTMKLSNKNLKRLYVTPSDGGNRFSWKDIPELQIKAYLGKDNTYRDTYGRMFWDKPSPTITTKFCSISNGRFAHPEENRGLSLREGATLQTFPKDYVFFGKSILSISRHIGNAVPPELSKRIGLTLIS